MVSKFAKLFPCTEPYRLFFLVGILSAFLGVLIWPLFQWGLLDFYPREAHAGLLLFGFFYAFVTGFFMTAVPRMMGARTAHPLEIALALGLILGQIFLALNNYTAVQWQVYVLQLALLAFFLLRRLLEKRKIPFEGFYFIPFAMFWSFLGLFLLHFKHFQNLSQITPLLVDAFLLNLICGLGSRLLPVISRMPNAIQPTENSPALKKVGFLVSAIILNSSFVFYLFGERYFGNFIVGIYLVYHGVVHFSLFEKPLQKSIAHFGFRMAVLTMVFAKLLVSIPHFNFIALNHLFYISGLFLLTLLVATRVMLAHSGQDLSYEIVSRRLRLVIWLLVVTGFMRWFSGQDIQSLTLLLASFLFLAALLGWGHKYLKLLAQSYTTIK